MSRQIHLWQEEVVEADDSTTVSVTIEYPDRSQTRLWYCFPVWFKNLLVKSCDPFVVATIMMAMSQSTDVRVHGEVSPSLLQNLAEFQMAWACWRPSIYKPIEITGEVEREQIRIEPTDKAISAFSGGVDSCFTMFRHRTGRCGRVQRNIQAGLMVRGFDIPLEQKQVFDRAAEKSKAILDSLGVELILMTSNYREVIQLNWEDTYGTAIASCMMLLQGGYSTGLLGSAFPYQNLMLPRGSSPVTDHLLSNKAFQIVHDGAGCTRLQKIQEIANWSEALRNLRVCWEGKQLDRNCGRCEKCIRTILGFRVLGFGLPLSFEQDVTDSQILGIECVKNFQLAELELILQTARSAGISDSWVSALEQCIQRNQHRGFGDKSKATPRKQLPLGLRSGLGKVRSLLSGK